MGHQATRRRSFSVKRKQDRDFDDRPQSWHERARAGRLPTQVIGGVPVEPEAPAELAETA